MHVDGGSQWAHQVVRRDGHKVRLVQRSDLAHLQHATDNADVRLDDVDTAYLQQPQELEAAVRPLAGGQSALQATLESVPDLEVVRPYRLLEEQRIAWRQHIAELYCLGRLEDLGMRIERARSQCPYLGSPSTNKTSSCYICANVIALRSQEACPFYCRLDTSEGSLPARFDRVDRLAHAL